MTEVYSKKRTLSGKCSLNLKGFPSRSSTWPGPSLCCIDQGLDFFDLHEFRSFTKSSKDYFRLSQPLLMRKKTRKLVWLKWGENNISLRGSRTHFKRSHQDMKAFSFFPFIFNPTHVCLKHRPLDGGN